MGAIPSLICQHTLAPRKFALKQASTGDSGVATRRQVCPTNCSLVNDPLSAVHLDFFKAHDLRRGFCFARILAEIFRKQIARKRSLAKK